MYILIATIAFLTAALVYFIPAMIAISRNHLNAMAIFLTNFLLGWTVLGWVFALIWSFTNNPAGVADKTKPAIKLWKFIALVAVFLVAPLVAVFSAGHKSAERVEAVHAPAVQSGVPLPADQLFGK
jgi:surface polysaccharide O-acyltransferase-like enzyme